MESETGRGTERRFTPRAVRTRGETAPGGSLGPDFEFRCRTAGNSFEIVRKTRDKAGFRSFQPNLRYACGIFFENLVDCK